LIFIRPATADSRSDLDGAVAEKDEEEEAEESEECAVPVCHDGRRCSGPMFILPGFVAARFDIGRGAVHVNT
jgi:hypothetical protein